jgi:hypothetical protein
MVLLCNSVPVGDWMWRPYGPYIGCADGAIEQLDRLLAMAAKYQMKVLVVIICDYRIGLGLVGIHNNKKKKKNKQINNKNKDGLLAMAATYQMKVLLLII